MTNEEALKLFKDHKYMTDYSFQDEMSEIAIRSLQAWDEVLQELEELKQEFKNDGRIHEAIAVNISIKRIKEHLAEIEK